MENRYVIKTVNGYVEWASIFSVDGKVEINRVNYTEDLQKADLYSESDYQEDKKAWEKFLNRKEGEGFSFVPIQLKLK